MCRSVTSRLISVPEIIYVCLVHTVETLPNVWAIGFCGFLLSRLRAQPGAPPGARTHEPEIKA